jgi:hypothetical protein
VSNDRVKNSPAIRRVLPLFCAFALLTASCSPSTTSGEKPRVIVLGIDGGTWDVAGPMMAAGQLPNLKKLYDSGLHGTLVSRPPILSPVVWTTIFTGFGYQKHGVKDWKTSQSVNRRVSAIWEILRDRKMSVDVFNVPATWPPDPIPGVMLSGFPLSGATFGGNTGEFVTTEMFEKNKLPVAYRDNTAAIREAVEKLPVKGWSPWIDGRVSSRPSFRGKLRAYRVSENEIYLTPLYRVDDGLVISEPKDLKKKVSDKLGEPYIPEGPGWSRWEDEKVPEVLYPHLDQVFTNQSRAALEYAGGDWDLFLFVMTLVDRVSHPYWAYGHTEAYPGLDLEKAKKYESAVADSYRRSDEELGKFVATVKGNPYFVIVSDHGFQSAGDPTKAIGTHNPNGIYLVAGPGIQPAAGQDQFIEDVTPTLLYLLGMPVGQDMDGKIFPDVAKTIGRKPAAIASYEAASRDSTDEPVDNDTWEQLRGLGYVDGAAPRSQKKDGAGDKVAAPEGDKAAPEGDKAAPEGKPAGNGGKPGAKDDALEDWPEPSHDQHEETPPAGGH